MQLVRQPPVSIVRHLQALACLLVLLENFVKILRAEQEIASDARKENGQRRLGSPPMLTAQTCALQDDGRTKPHSLPISCAKVAPLANLTHKLEERMKLSALYVLVESSPVKLALPTAMIVLLDSSTSTIISLELTKVAIFALLVKYQHQALPIATLA